MDQNTTGPTPTSPATPTGAVTERRAPTRLRSRRSRRTTAGTTLAAVLAAVAVVQFYPERETPLGSRPFAGAADAIAMLPFATPTEQVYGRSGAVSMQFALPGEQVTMPLVVEGSRAAYAYQWVRAVDSVARGALRPLATAADELLAPTEPGFYRLALVRQDGEQRLVDGVTVSVLVPFSEKRGAVLNGFRLGTWVGERGSAAARRGLPQGFVPVDSAALELPVSRHLKLGDVLRTPDTRRLGFPDYGAVDTRLLEKLELVLAEVTQLASSQGTPAARTPRLSVNSGFRPPSYNQGVAGAASNSRHQYGDAADVRIDVNGDGRFSLAELRLVTRAVEVVEREHPDLAGGLGLYTSKRYREPYVHIDARGKRARWTL